LLAQVRFAQVVGQGIQRFRRLAQVRAVERTRQVGGLVRPGQRTGRVLVGVGLLRQHPIAELLQRLLGFGQGRDSFLLRDIRLLEDIQRLFQRLGEGRLFLGGQLRILADRLDQLLDLGRLVGDGLLHRALGAQLVSLGIVRQQQVRQQRRQQHNQRDLAPAHAGG